MGLSEQERKVLEEMERALYEDDSKLAARMSKAGDTAAKRAVERGKPSPKRLIAGVLTAVVGLSVLLVAAIIHYIVFGIVGFGLMLWGLVLASSNWSSSALKDGKPKARRTDGFTDFLNERWDRRTGN